MKESKEAALKKLEAVCKSESFQHMSKEGLKSSFGEYNKDNSEINKIKYDYNNNSIAHGTDTMAYTASALSYPSATSAATASALSSAGSGPVAA